MPTVHYVSRALLNENGLHHLQLDNPPLANNGNDDDLNRRTVTVAIPRTQLNFPPNEFASKSTVAKGKKDGTSITSSTSSFNDRVKDLKAYKEKYGHVNVSRKTDKSLFNWCTKIRSSRNKPGEGKLKLTADRITALDAIGFNWRSETTALSASRPKWNFQDHVNSLKAYETQHGHLNVKQTEDKNLYHWCTNIRSARNKPGEGKLKLTANRIAALDAIRFDWRSETTRTREKSISFQDRVKALSEYKEINGHLNVKQTEDKNLYHWCANIRCTRKNPEKYVMKLTAERIASLDAIGFDWNPIGGQGGNNFQDRVAALREYKEKNGHLNVSKKDDKSLYNWCSNIRNARKNPEACTMKLTADRIATLDAIGFDWRSEGLSRNYQKHISFQDRVKALSEYKEINGHLNVKQTEDKNLYHWCSKIRSTRKNPEKYVMKLTADRTAALDGIGFDWKIGTKPRGREKTINFQDRVEALREYKKKNGHLNVSLADNKSLKDWCSNIRNARNKPAEGKLKLTANRIAALDAIGFDWRSETTRTREKSISFQDRVDALREYKKENGHLSITQKDDTSLFDWCSNIRNARRGKLGMKLTTNGIAALDAIGFDWRSETSSRTRNKTISFQDRVKALRQYKEKHGHLNVTFKANKNLNNWCYNIRNARSKSGKGTMKLTQERIEALDAIGFDWRLSKSVLQPFDSLGGDADNAPDKSEENNDTVLDCQYVGDVFHHDYLEHEGISNASVTVQKIGIDSLTAEEKTMFNAIERSISAAEELEQTEATI